MTPNRPTDDRALADALLAALWRRVWVKVLDLGDNPQPARRYYQCQECNVKAPTKLAVRHLPGCVLARVPADRLAAAAGWEEAGEPT